MCGRLSAASNGPNSVLEPPALLIQFSANFLVRGCCEKKLCSSRAARGTHSRRRACREAAESCESPEVRAVPVVVTDERFALFHGAEDREVRSEDGEIGVDHDRTGIVADGLTSEQKDRPAYWFPERLWTFRHAKPSFRAPARFSCGGRSGFGQAENVVRNVPCPTLRPIHPARASLRGAEADRLKHSLRSLRVEFWN